MNISHRPTQRLVQLIGDFERFSGRWDRVGALDSQENAAECRMALAETIRVGRELESPLRHVSLQSDELVDSPELGRIAALVEHESDLLSLDAIGAINLALEEIFARGQNQERGVSASVFRSQAAAFRAALDESSDTQSIVVPAVSPFLVQIRLGELLEWMKDEGAHHIIRIGVAHLLMLQISPFRRQHHLLSLVWLHLMLLSSGYLQFSKHSPAPYFLRRRSSYLNALRQADKTAHETWSTLNIWLEFLATSLLELSEETLAREEGKRHAMRLTSVQRRIIEVVRDCGPTTRETIVEQTGLNLSTVKYNLGVLNERGHLARQGGGRSTSYRVN